MDRWKITYDSGTVLKLYYKDKKDIPLKDIFGNVISIEPCADRTYEEYIRRIKEMSVFTGYDYRNRECYRCNYYKGCMEIRLLKDEGGSYFDLALYQEHIKGNLSGQKPFEISNPKTVYYLLIAKEPQYIIYSHRFYGERRLAKPVELKNIDSIGSAVFIQKKCNPKIYLTGNDIWIKHTDYFSYTWQPPEGEKIGMPLSYYLEKYFSTSRKQKFVYSDAWGDIVLRNEAWILLKDYIPLVETEDCTMFAEQVLSQQVKDEYSKGLDLHDMEWIRFYEDVHRIVKTHLMIPLGGIKYEKEKTAQEMDI